MGGEFVRVTNDPEGESGNEQDRWVYGRSEETQQVGWFPLSHTVAPEDVEEAEDDDKDAWRSRSGLNSHTLRLHSLIDWIKFFAVNQLVFGASHYSMYKTYAIL